MSNSIVQSLVRAAASIPSDITDKELDTYVADLLAREAKEKEVKWREYGLSAYLEGGMAGSGLDGPDPSLPKTNKRFLSSIIRTTDDHNSALLREQARAARIAISDLDQRRSSPSSSSRIRSDTAGIGGETTRNSGGRAEGEKGRRDGKSGAMRMFGGAIGNLGENRSRDKSGTASRGGGADRTQGESVLRGSDEKRSGDRVRSAEATGTRPSEGARADLRNRESHQSESSRRMTDRSAPGSDDRRPDDEHVGRRTRREEHNDGSSESKKSARTRSRDMLWNRTPDRAPSRTDRDAGPSDRRSSHRRERQDGRRTRDDIPDSPSGPGKSSRHPGPAPSKRSPSVNARTLEPDEPFYDPPPTTNNSSCIPSKMDRYFSPAYDPALDFTGVLPIPKTGLVVQDVGWENMLSVLKDKGKKKRAREENDDDFESGPKQSDWDRERKKDRPHSLDRRKPSIREHEHPREKEISRTSKRRTPSPDIGSDYNFSSESEGTRRRRKRKERKSKEREEEKVSDEKARAKVSAREWDMGKAMPF